MYIKEFRFYTRALDSAEVDFTRYHNGNYEDLTYTNNLHDWSQYMV